MTDADLSTISLPPYFLTSLPLLLALSEPKKQFRLFIRLLSFPQFLRAILEWPVSESGKAERFALHRERVDEFAVELADVTVQVSGLREAPLAPLAGVGLLACVHHGMPAQVVRVLEALAARGARVGLLARVCPLVPLQRVHARERLATDGACGHVDIAGSGFSACTFLLAEVRAQVDLQHVRTREHLVAQGAHEDLRVRRTQHARHVWQQRALLCPLGLTT